MLLGGILLYPSLKVATVSTFELFQFGKKCIQYLPISLSNASYFFIDLLHESCIYLRWTPLQYTALPMNVLPRASLRLGSACVHNTVVAIIHFYITLFLYKFGSLTGACAGVPRGPRSPRAQGCVLGPIPSGLAQHCTYFTVLLDC